MKEFLGIIKDYALRLVFWLNGDVWLGDGYKLEVNHADSGYIVRLEHIESDIVLFASDPCVNHAKIMLKSELEVMLMLDGKYS